MGNKNLKIVVIGGGSTYTPELIEGFIKRYENLPVTEICLCDISEGLYKLNIISAFANRMVKKSGLPIKISSSINRKEALEGADFVITQIRVGQLESRIKDETIPLKYNVIGQETNGVGGMFKALRTIPVILDIDREMGEICPNAWLINFTNPTGIITEALLKYGRNKKIIGLCNVPINMEKGVASILNVDDRDIRIEFAGLNHLVYGLKIFSKGLDVTATVIDKIALGELGNGVKNIKDLEWEADFIRALNVMPCPYHRYYYQTSKILEDELEEYSKGNCRSQFVKKTENELLKLYDQPTLDTKPTILENRGGAFYSDSACKLIDSIYNDKKDIQAVNTQNRGAICDIDYNSAVEVSCIITKDGPKPISVGKLPTAINGLVQTIKSFEKLVVESAIEGSYEKALLALTINPLVPSESLAKVLLDELLNVHIEYLPQFNKSFNSKFNR